MPDVGIPNWLAPLISSLTVLIVGWVLNGSREKDKARDQKVDSLATKVIALELTMSRELATKADLDPVWTRIEDLAKTMSEIKDMVVRLDERSKIHDKE